MTTVQKPAKAEAIARPGSPPAVQLLQLMKGAMVSQVLAVTARLGVADALADGPRTPEEIARRVEADAASLLRLLRAAADCGVLGQLEDGRFVLTQVGELLRSDVPTSLKALATMVGMPFHRDAWTDLYTSIKTGECAFTRVHGADWFTYLALHPEEAGVFDAAMTSITVSMQAGVVRVYDFSRFSTVVDVGGGQGALLAAILGANQCLRGVLFDTPSAAAEARATLHHAGVAARSEVVEGDFFATVPSGGDLYILSNILHDWEDAAAQRILRTCRTAMRVDARLLIVEQVLPDAPVASFATLGDLEMLALTGGRQRTPTQFGELLSGAGLRLAKAVPSVLDCPDSYIEAIAV